MWYDELNSISWFHDELRGMCEHLILYEDLTINLWMKNKPNWKTIAIDIRENRKAKIGVNDNLTDNSKNSKTTMLNLIIKNRSKIFCIKSESVSIAPNEFKCCFAEIAYKISSKIESLDRYSLAYLNIAIPINNLFNFSGVSSNKMSDVIYKLMHKNSSDISGLNISHKIKWLFLYFPHCQKCMKVHVSIPLTKHFWPVC